MPFRGERKKIKLIIFQGFFILNENAWFRPYFNYQLDITL